MIIALLFHIVALLGIFAFVALLLHYKREYSFAEEHKKITVIAFLVVITALMILSTVAFSRVPWETLRHIIA